MGMRRRFTNRTRRVVRALSFFLDPTWSVVIALLTILGATAAQFVGVESNETIDGGAIIVRPNGVLWVLVLVIGVNSLWLLTLLVLHNVREDMFAEDNLRTFESHDDLNAPLYDTISNNPGCDVRVMCQGSRGFNGLVWSETFRQVGSAVVYFTMPAVAPVLQRPGIRKTQQVVSDLNGGRYVSMITPPATRAVLVRSRGGTEPLWLSVSTYVPSGMRSGAPTIVFTEFSSRISGEYLEFVEREFEAADNEASPS